MYIDLRYAHWNTYAYNQQVNPTAYSSGSSGSMGAPSSGTSSYSQYPEQASNSRYPYAPSNQTNVNDYYSQYGYGAPQQAGVYSEPNGKYHVSKFFSISNFHKNHF